ncbi:hypothetical protein ACFL3T_02650 [Patescibacteria group bacterium]
MSKQKQKSKIDLKNLLDEISFKSPQKKQEWLDLIEYMDEKELKQVYNHFIKRQDKEKEIKLKLIVKYGLQDTYMKGMDKLAKIYIQKAKNKNKE